MPDISCGASVQACALRIAVLEQDGVPVPGATNAYITDQFAKLTATPVYFKGIDLQVPNACGTPSVIYKDRDRLIRYDLALDMLFLSADFETMLVGGELFTLGGFSVGASSPQIAKIEAPYGVSLEIWSKHIVNGDYDPVNPYIQWVYPRSYWSVGPDTFDNSNNMRAFTGYTSQNPNYEDGPFGDWVFASDRSRMWRYTSVLPTPICGATVTPGS